MGVGSTVEGLAQTCRKLASAVLEEAAVGSILETVVRLAYGGKVLGLARALQKLTCVGPGEAAVGNLLETAGRNPAPLLPKDTVAVAVEARIHNPELLLMTENTVAAEVGQRSHGLESLQQKYGLPAESRASDPHPKTVDLPEPLRQSGSHLAGLLVQGRNFRAVGSR